MQYFHSPLNEQYLHAHNTTDSASYPLNIHHRHEKRVSIQPAIAKCSTGHDTFFITSSVAATKLPKRLNGDHDNDNTL